MNAYVIALVFLALGMVCHAAGSPALNSLVYAGIIWGLYPMGWLYRMARADQPWSGATPREVLTWDSFGCLSASLSGGLFLLLLFHGSTLVALSVEGLSSGGWWASCLLPIAQCCLAVGSFIAAGPSLPPEDRVLSRLGWTEVVTP